MRYPISAAVTTSAATTIPQLQTAIYRRTIIATVENDSSEPAPASWTSGRISAVAAVALLALGWSILLALSPTVPCHYIRALYPLLLVALGSLVAGVWATVKRGLWWGISVLLAIWLLTSVLGMFEGC